MDANEHLTKLRHLLLKEDPDWDKARMLLIRWLASGDPGIGIGADYTMRMLDSLNLITSLRAEQGALFQRINELEHKLGLAKILLEGFATGEFTRENLFRRAIEVGLIREVPAPTSNYVPGTCPLCGLPNTGGTVCYGCRR